MHLLTFTLALLLPLALSQTSPTTTLPPRILEPSDTGRLLASPTTTAQFVPPLPTLLPASPNASDPDQGGGCLPRYHDCSVVGRAEWCCALEEVCSADEEGRLACCAYGAKCVSSLDVGSGAVRVEGIGEWEAWKVGIGVWVGWWVGWA